MNARLGLHPGGQIKRVRVVNNCLTSGQCDPIATGHRVRYKEPRLALLKIVNRSNSCIIVRVPIITNCRSQAVNLVQFARDVLECRIENERR